VRALMARVARDEARHAALAFAVQRWAAPRLGRSAQRNLADRRHDAIAELETQAGQGWTPELGVAAGVPAPRAARALLGELRETLWT
jgi:hypothetical protein